MGFFLMMHIYILSCVKQIEQKCIHVHTNASQQGIDIFLHSGRNSRLRITP